MRLQGSLQRHHAIDPAAIDRFHLIADPHAQPFRRSLRPQAGDDQPARRWQRPEGEARQRRGRAHFDPFELAEQLRRGGEQQPAEQPTGDQRRDPCEQDQPVVAARRRWSAHSLFLTPQPSPADGADMTDRSSTAALIHRQMPRCRLARIAKAVTDAAEAGRVATGPDAKSCEAREGRTCAPLIRRRIGWPSRSIAACGNPDRTARA